MYPIERFNEKESIEFFDGFYFVLGYLKLYKTLPYKNDIEVFRKIWNVSVSF